MRHDTRTPRLSVVVVSLNEGARLQATVENLVGTLPSDAELVIVDDGSDDGSADFVRETRRMRLVRTGDCGVARARNLGARRAHGDVIVFADAHIEVPPGWWRPVLDALDDPAIGAVAPAIAVAGDPQRKGFGLRFEAPDLEIEWLTRQGAVAYEVPILPGCCLAMRRDVFDATGGFDAGMIRSGGVDNELAVRLWLLGYGLRVVPEVTVLHAFRDRHPYSISWRTVLHNKLRLALVHFGADRLLRVMEALRGRREFAEGLALTSQGRIESRRRAIAARRVRDDAWFFERFAMSW